MYWPGSGQQPWAGNRPAPQPPALATRPASRNGEADPPLRQRAIAKNLLYGAAVQQRHLAQDPEFAAHFVRECAILVPESELKWRRLRPQPHQFNFAPGDRLVAFGRTHGLQIRGHTLVWHEALPTWFKETVNRRNAEKMLREHIHRVMGHYAGQIHSWDVVNEAIHPGHGHPQSLRTSPWLQLLGPAYLDIAFEAAAAADPATLLVYNDHWLEYDTPNGRARRKAVLNLLSRLKSRGVPIQALGIQAHLMRDQPRFNPAQFRQFLREVASLDLKILITELDVTDQKLPGDPLVRDRLVAAAYEDYLNAALEEPAVIAVLTWGLSDRYTWLSDHNPRADGRPVRPLPLDANLNRKPTWKAIARSFDQASPQRRVLGTQPGTNLAATRQSFSAQNSLPLP